jgi:Phosphoinositide phospholipase C, Ca2+-dependent
MFIRPGYACCFAFFGLAFGPSIRAADGPRIDQIQVIGSHNSYHLAPHPNVLGLLGERAKAASKALDYTHRPLAEQFNRLGLRSIELDVFADPEGGRYAEPWARKILQGLRREPGPDPNFDGRLRKPGFKVFHIQDIDYQSTVTTLLEGLRQVRDWSEAHPRHVPILVQLELKDDPVAALPTRPVAFDKPMLDAIDAEIRSIFEPGDFISPDDLRGSHATLPEAIKAEGWPALEASRGKVLFALDNEGALRDLYLADHPALRGRAMFVSVDPEHPAAAWMKRNDPVREFDEIQALVKAGFLVRTRADADTVEARKDDQARRDKALASGAQFISTDFPEPRPDLSPYQVRLPGGIVARSNPISGDRALVGIDLESHPEKSPPRE